jgi:GTPase SAR1 family protein
MWSSKRELRVLIVGLDAAGKTTALYRLQLGDEPQFMPAMACNTEPINLRNCTIMAWDISGQSQVCLARACNRSRLCPSITISL